MDFFSLLDIPCDRVPIYLHTTFALVHNVLFKLTNITISRLALWSSFCGFSVSWLFFRNEDCWWLEEGEKGSITHPWFSSLSSLAFPASTRMRLGQRPHQLFFKSLSDSWLLISLGVVSDLDTSGLETDFTCLFPRTKLTHNTKPKPRTATPTAFISTLPHLYHLNLLFHKLQNKKCTCIFFLP